MTAYPPLVDGAQGPAVVACQRALYPALLSIDGTPTNAKNGSYGVKTIRDVEVFQRVQKILVFDDAHPAGYATGKCGARTWEALAPFIDEYGQSLLEKQADLDDQHDEETREAYMRRGLMVAASWYVDNAASIRYAQERPIPYGRNLPKRTDCSGSFIDCYYQIGAPDPSGNGYNGRGWTGDLRAHGQRISLDDAKAGDAVHYTNPATGSQHVAMLTSTGGVFTFGSNPPHYEASPWYRPVVMVTRHDL